ncbi:hypothetical protein [Thiocapsa marina]|nr:hypothetical protein [Thiocapsa marina]
MIALAALALSAQAADISLTGGDWSETIDAGDLIAGAGSDIRSPIESGSYQATLDISNTGGALWTVGVQRSGSSLPSGVTLAVRRTSDGSGGGSITGGQSYLTVGSLEQAIFYGSGDRSGIRLQLRLDGVSVGNGPGAYDTTLIYRIY